MASYGHALARSSSNKTLKVLPAKEPLVGSSTQVRTVMRLTSGRTLPGRLSTCGSTRRGWRDRRRARRRRVRTCGATAAISGRRSASGSRRPEPAPRGTSRRPSCPPRTSTRRPRRRAPTLAPSARISCRNPQPQKHLSLRTPVALGRGASSSASSLTRTTGGARTCSGTILRQHRRARISHRLHERRPAPRRRAGRLCRAAHRRHGPKGDPRSASRGAEVVAALGSPNVVTTDPERNETWVYDKVATESVYSTSSGNVAGASSSAAAAISAVPGSAVSGARRAPPPARNAP